MGLGTFKWIYDTITDHRFCNTGPEAPAMTPKKSVRPSPQSEKTSGEPDTKRPREQLTNNKGGKAKPYRAGDSSEGSTLLFESGLGGLPGAGRLGGLDDPQVIADAVTGNCFQKQQQGNH